MTRTCKVQIDPLEGIQFAGLSGEQKVQNYSIFPTLHIIFSVCGQILYQAMDKKSTEVSRVGIPKII